MNIVPLSLLIAAGSAGELLGSLPAGLLAGSLLNIALSIIGAREIRKGSE